MCSAFLLLKFFEIRKRPAEIIIRRKSADIKGNNKRIKQVAEDFSPKPRVKTTVKKLLDFFGKKLYNNMYVFFFV